MRVLRVLTDPKSGHCGFGSHPGVLQSGGRFLALPGDASLLALAVAAMVSESPDFFREDDQIVDASGEYMGYVAGGTFVGAPGARKVLFMEDGYGILSLHGATLRHPVSRAPFGRETDPEEVLDALNGTINNFRIPDGALVALPGRGGQHELLGRRDGYLIVRTKT